jgi:hypothetical protein
MLKRLIDKIKFWHENRQSEKFWLGYAKAREMFFDGITLDEIESSACSSDSFDRGQIEFVNFRRNSKFGSEYISPFRKHG